MSHVQSYNYRACCKDSYQHMRQVQAGNTAQVMTCHQRARVPDPDKLTSRESINYV